MDASIPQQGLTLIQQICIYSAPPLVAVVGWFISHYISNTDKSIEDHTEKFDEFKEKYSKDQEEVRKKISGLVAEVRKDMHKNAMMLVDFQKDLGGTMREAQNLIVNLKQEYAEQRRVLNMLTEMKERVEILTMEVQDVKDLPEKVTEISMAVESVGQLIHRVKDEHDRGRIFIIEEQKKNNGRIILLEDIQSRHKQALSGAAQALKMHRKELDELKKRKKDDPSSSSGS